MDGLTTTTATTPNGTTISTGTVTGEDNESVTSTASVVAAVTVTDGTTATTLPPLRRPSLPPMRDGDIGGNGRRNSLQSEENNNDNKKNSQQQQRRRCIRDVLLSDTDTHSYSEDEHENKWTRKELQEDVIHILDEVETILSSTPLLTSFELYY